MSTTDTIFFLFCDETTDNILDNPFSKLHPLEFVLHLILSQTLQPLDSDTPEIKGNNIIHMGLVEYRPDFFSTLVIVQPYIF